MNGTDPARVYVVEEMGNETFARLQSDTATITARVPPELKIDFDQAVWLRPRPGKEHFFDATTTEAIR